MNDFSFLSLIAIIETSYGIYFTTGGLLFHCVLFLGFSSLYALCNYYIVKYNYCQGDRIYPVPLTITDKRGLASHVAEREGYSKGYALAIVFVDTLLDLARCNSPLGSCYFLALLHWVRILI